MAFPIELPPGAWSIKSVDTHTSGEPLRTVFQGYPEVKGTLLEQRAEAKAKYDHIRQALILESRGHTEMYGAILRPNTELTESGEAHIGVLFMHNEGYSTMCGHATIALGRWFIDCHDLDVFPMRNSLPFDAEKREVTIHLHAPCGLVTITAPTTEDGQRSDPSRPVSFVDVPSFAPGVNLPFTVPSDLAWPELKKSRKVTIDIGYGGAFYALISTSDLGFPSGLNLPSSLTALDFATRRLKKAIMEDPVLSELIKHPEHDDLSFLYSVIVVDDSNKAKDDANHEELGICFFGDQQIDRSPTGSGAAARVAVAHAKGIREIGQWWTYHSMVSKYAGKGGFDSKVESVTELKGPKGESITAVNVRVAGHAYYTGYHEHIVEKEDPLPAGFLVNRISI